MRHASKTTEKYCYQVYLQLPNDYSYEILEGNVYAMTPAPAVRHQLVLRNILVMLVNSMKNTECEVISAPCDLLLPEKDEDIEHTSTVVQPDIFVVCDRSKLKDKYCLGAPDLIVEVVSPSRPSIDYVKKLHIYEKHSVREYWIVNYTQKEVMIYKLDNNEYNAPKICLSGTINSGIFRNLKLSLEDIFR